MYSAHLAEYTVPTEAAGIPAEEETPGGPTSTEGTAAVP